MREGPPRGAGAPRLLPRCPGRKAPWETISLCVGKGRGGLEQRWDRFVVTAQGAHGDPAPSAALRCRGAPARGRDGAAPSPSVLPRKPLRAARCRCSYSWPSPARSSALREPAVISSVIKGLGACSTSLKKQDNNNNNDLCSGMLPSGVGIASSAFWLRKLFVLQPRQIDGAAHGWCGAALPVHGRYGTRGWAPLLGQLLCLEGGTLGELWTLQLAV